MNKLLKWLGFTPKDQEITFKIDLPPWQDHNAQELHAFLKTPTGSLFLQQLKKYQMDVNQWATDVSQEAYDNMKYRACVAHGVKLKLDQILRMSKPAPVNKHKKEVDEQELDRFFNTRMGIFKS